MKTQTNRVRILLPIACLLWVLSSTTDAAYAVDEGAVEATVAIMVDGGTVGEEGVPGEMLGIFPVGTRVTVTADDPAPGQVFDFWAWVSADGESQPALPNATDEALSAVTFDAPNMENLTFTAHYADLPVFALATPDSPEITASAASTGGLSITIKPVLNAKNYTVSIYRKDAVRIGKSENRSGKVPVEFPMGYGEIIPGERYSATVIAIGDGGQYSDSAESAHSALSAAGKAAPNARQFSINSGYLIYSGQPQPVSVTINGGKGMGEFTVHYQNSAGTTTAPTDAGGYHVYVDIVEGDYYYGAIDLDVGQILIQKAAAGDVIPPQPIAVERAEAHQVVLPALLTVADLPAPMETGAVVFALGQVSDPDGVLEQPPHITGDILHLPVADGVTAGASVRLNISVTADNIVPLPAEVELAVQILPTPIGGRVVVTGEGGTVLAGSVLTADVTAVIPATGLTFQWERDGVAIAEAKAQNYRLPKDATGVFSVVATAHGNYTGSLTSGKVGVTQPAVVDPPAVDPPVVGDPPVSGTDRPYEPAAPPAGEITARPPTVVFAPAKQRADGVFLAAVRLQAVRDGLTQAVKAAAGTGMSPRLIIRVESGAADVAAGVALPAGAMSAVAAQGAELQISFGVGAIALDTTAVAAVADQAQRGEVTFFLGGVTDQTDLSVPQRNAVAGAAAFEIFIDYGGVRIGDFGGGSAVITLPYTLRAGETADGVGVWHVDRLAQLSRMPVQYSAERGTVALTTGHLSLYLVAWDPATGWSNPYADVDGADWFYEAVRAVSTSGLFRGSEGVFRPNVPMTRAMLVTALWRSAGAPESGTAQFSDVTPGTWCAPAIAWAGDSGIVQGVGGGRFDPDGALTREQCAVLLWRFSGQGAEAQAGGAAQGTASNLENVSPWAAEGMRWALHQGLMTGRGAGSLDPGAPASRAEAAALLQRFTQQF